MINNPFANLYMIMTPPASSSSSSSTDEPSSLLQTRYCELYKRYEEYHQSHLLKFYPDLTNDEKHSLLNQLESIPIETIDSLFQSAQNNAHCVKSDDIQPFRGAVGDVGKVRIETNAWEVGVEAVRLGKVAAVTLAGGQGTRLGFAGPKGKYVLPQFSSSLFGVVAQRIVRLKSIASSSEGESCVRLPWYIMTSPLNDAETRQFFRSNSYFGLDEEDVVFFKQGTLPCLDFEGKVLLKTKSEVAEAPDGNGGIWTQMKNDNLTADMRKRGVDYLHIFSIDNALVRPADPTFVGYCINESADCGNKVLWKSHAFEKVGVIAEIHGRPQIVEYSDMSQSLCEKVDENGKLLFGAGNICNHFFTVDFVENMIMPSVEAASLYHIAKKKISCVDISTGVDIKATENNGIKLETFIFDVFPLSEKMAVLNVNRDEEFAPVKNAPDADVDSPYTARKMISDLAKKYAIAAGYVLTGDVQSDECEISPLTSYSGEGIDGNGKSLVCPFRM